MANVGPVNSVGCAPFRRALAMDRRAFLRAGVLGTAGLGLGQLLRLEARGAVSPTSKGGRQPSVIILWMRGGPSHLDTFDPKPDAPVEYRGEFGSIPTKIPGVRLVDMFPMSAAIMDKWSLVRSLHHDDPGHSTGDQICFTGYPPGSEPDVNHRPSCGSIVSKLLGDQSPHLPPYVMIPKMAPGTGSAYLGIAHNPFETMADPATPGPFKIPNFALPKEVSLGRFQDRRALMADFDRLRRDAETSGQLEACDRFDLKAWDILTSKAARDAFELDKEDPRIRQRYGFMPRYIPAEPQRCGSHAWSQRILLARRLVEAGVRLVTVELRWWDTHFKGFDSLRVGFLPRFDQAYSALIEDLDQRGLLESTLVLAWGEFGRTPRVNKDAGRDHYPAVFSAAFAGGPVKGGRVVGSSDAHGAYPASEPKTPQDVLATVYDHLGIDYTASFNDHQGRPIPILPSGTPIRELS